MLLVLATLLFTAMFAVAAASLLHDLTRPLAQVDRGIVPEQTRALPARQLLVPGTAVLSRVNRRPVSVRSGRSRSAPPAAAA